MSRHTNASVRNFDVEAKNKEVAVDGFYNYIMAEADFAGEHKLKGFQMSGDDCILRFDEPREGLIRQEFVSYETKDGMLYKKKITRVCEPSANDYIDSWSSTPIIKLSNEVFNFRRWWFYWSSFS